MANGTLKPATEVTKWAWEIHKDADALLHSRLQGFMAFNAILGGGYFLSLRQIQDASEGLIAFIPPIAASLATIFGLIFLIYTRRMVKGIRELKRKILLDDDIYKIYYGDHLTSKRVGYWFAYGIPWALIALWIILFGIGIAISVRG